MSAVGRIMIYKRKKIIKAFESNNATKPECAVTPSSIGCDSLGDATNITFGKRRKT